MKARDLAEKILDKYPITRQTSSMYVFENGDRKSKKKFKEEIFDMNVMMEISSEAAVMFNEKNADSQRKYKQRVFDDISIILKEYESAGHRNFDTARLEELNILHKSFNFDDFVLFKNMTPGS